MPNCTVQDSSPKESYSKEWKAYPARIGGIYRQLLLESKKTPKEEGVDGRESKGPKQDDTKKNFRPLSTYSPFTNQTLPHTLARPTGAEQLPDLLLSEVSKVVLLCGWIKWDYNLKDYFFFWQARMCWPLLCLCGPFCIFERCLDSNPESCRSKQARYQLSHPSPWPTNHPSPYFATHLPT